MRENREYGSVRGAPGNRCPYRDNSNGPVGRLDDLAEVAVDRAAHEAVGRAGASGSHLLSETISEEKGGHLRRPAQAFSDGENRSKKTGRITILPTSYELPMNVRSALFCGKMARWTGGRGSLHSRTDNALSVREWREFHENGW
jgi:hypothetical protein